MFPYPESNEYQAIRISQYGDMRWAQAARESITCIAVAPSRSRHRGSLLPGTVARWTTIMWLPTSARSLIPNFPVTRPQGEYQRYTSRCVAGRGFCMIDSTNAWIMARADELWESARGNCISYARLCYEYVARAFPHGMYSGDNSVEKIISRMSGDCGNQAGAGRVAGHRAMPGVALPGCLPQQHRCSHLAVSLPIYSFSPVRSRQSCCSRMAACQLARAYILLFVHGSLAACGLTECGFCGLLIILGKPAQAIGSFVQPRLDESFNIL